VVLFPVAITFYITWWFIQTVDGFSSPIYVRLGINIFGKVLEFLVVLYYLVEVLSFSSLTVILGLSLLNNPF
jgi:uncharacterized membrane protein